MIIYQLNTRYNTNLKHITFETILPEIKEEVKKPQNPEERYNHLKKINAKIDTLRKAFDFDIE
ncbi:MAG: hypothetical protein R6U95_05420 [Bacteroidales bacterium]